MTSGIHAPEGCVCISGLHEQWPSDSRSCTQTPPDLRNPSQKEAQGLRNPQPALFVGKAEKNTALVGHHE